MSNSKVTSQLSSDIFISLTTIPLLLILVGSKALGEVLKTLGQSSEEVFRGDRLPTLTIPPESK